MFSKSCPFCSASAIQFSSFKTLRIEYNPSLVKDDLLAPIFETSRRPGCLTAGIYLDDLDLLLFADFYGTIRLLKQKENGDWYLFHQYKQDNFIWGLGIDKVSNKIFIAPNNIRHVVTVHVVNRKRSPVSTCTENRR